MRTILRNFDGRADRSRFAAEQFRELLQGRVLDVGCFEGALRSLVPEGTEYLGIDIGGAPDLRLDLETAERLPFDDASFDTVVCTDVLEHLDNLHAVFAELVRLARHHVILSLPNCWTHARRPIERGRGTIGHYGLPADPPADRHKWFFSLTQARDFLREQARRHGLEVADMFAMEKPRLWLLRMLRRLRYPEASRYLNRYAHTLWCVLARRT